MRNSAAAGKADMACRLSSSDRWNCALTDGGWRVFSEEKGLASAPKTDTCREDKTAGIGGHTSLGGHKRTCTLWETGCGTPRIGR